MSRLCDHKYDTPRLLTYCVKILHIGTYSEFGEAIVVETRTVAVVGFGALDFASNALQHFLDAL